MSHPTGTSGTGTAASPVPHPSTPARPTVAATLMYLTYASGTVGIFLAFLTLRSDPPSLRWAALVAVGLSGVLSFLRHTVFHRSDAVRMGWDTGGRDNFQLEVGIANLAWGLVAILAVVLGWGLRVEAATFLTFGFYLTMVAVLLISSRPDDGTARPWGPVIGMASFGILLDAVGVMGMAAA